jgi:hypothetical protein
MIRFVLYLAIAVVIVYVAITVPFGKRTLVGHIRAIWHTEQVQDLKDGVKEKAGPAVERIERGVKAGYKEATGSSDGSDAGSGSGSGSAAPAGGW